MSVDHEHLQRRYRALDDPTRGVLEVLAVATNPLHLRDIVAAMKTAKQPWTRGTTVTQKAVSVLLDRLRDDDLAIPGQRKLYHGCNPTIRETIAVDLVLAGRYERILTSLEEPTASQRRWSYWAPTYDEVFHDLSQAVYLADAPAAADCVSTLLADHAERVADLHPLASIFRHPFRRDWFATLPPELRAAALAATIEARADRLEPLDDLTDLLRADKLTIVPRSWWRLHRGDPAEVPPSDDPWQQRARAAAWFLRGDDEAAEALLDTELKAWRRALGARKVFPGDLPGLWHLLARLALGGKARHKRNLHDVDAALRVPVGRIWVAYKGVEAAALAGEGEFDRAVKLVKDAVACERRRPGPGEYDDRTLNPYVAYLAAAACMVDVKLARPLVPGVERIREAAGRNGYRVVELVASEALGRLAPRKRYAPAAARLRKDHGLRAFVPDDAVKSGWSRALAALAELGDTSRADTGKDRRLAWLVKVVDEERIWFAPREQKRTKRGGWTAGRAVALRRLFKRDAKLDYLTEQDHAMCNAISISHDYYGREEFDIDHTAMLAAAVGHPLLFSEDDPCQRVEVVQRNLELEVHETSRGYEVALSPDVTAAFIQVALESPTRIAVTPISKTQRRVSAVLGGKLQVPKSGAEELRAALANLANLVIVRSEMAQLSPEAETVAADATMRLRIRPSGEAFHVALRVTPLGPEGPVYRPGEGGRTVLATVDERTVEATRDLATERAAAWELVSECAPLAASPSPTFDWILADSAECLELLLATESAPGEVVVEWPEGKALPRPRRLGEGALRVAVRAQRGWFEVQGEAAVDETQIITLKRLLELIEQGDGAFVELAPGQILALTETLRRRCRLLGRLGEPHGEGLRVTRAAAMALDEAVEGFGRIKRSKTFRDAARRMRSSDPAPIPSTFRASLRDYQLEGFHWLSRLADLGLGACLADDMGLGKTVQALALLVRRAEEGPALVVAPTSVCAGWESEAARFAPTLRVQRLGTAGRADQIAALGPFDVLVASYGLLTSERKRLADTDWTTIVLDEAQAIKNVATKRSRAAHDLSAECRVVTTGTPIENHLGELWSLMHFLNPGLLGTFKRFERRFATPIERDRDAAARAALRALIRPFVLRRSKADVLDELPPRTEVTLRLDLSAEEAALYEATRRRAVDAIEAAEPNARRFRVLAELTRLRQACCHPRLVAPGCGLAGAKMAALTELVHELRDGGHKALVFSQFVSFLQIARETLDELGVSYMYLDGSTPPAARKAQVDAFQRGEGELFLISLRAGGLGLNLTAADYVVHLDPWWNPAVEDQASDRAHRIGQTRPVTVYRLVARDTVEERILALHRSKRELAERLLEGTDAPGELDLDALVALVRGD